MNRELQSTVQPTPPNKLFNKAILGYLFALGATAVWSGNFIVARGLGDSLSPVSIAFWRWTVAVLVCLPFGLKNTLRQKEIIRAHLGYLALAALLGVTLFNTLIYIAGHTTSAINLSLISITCPVFIVVLMRIFFQERITMNRVIGIILVAVGIVSLVTRGQFGQLLDLTFAVGDLWMLTAAVIFAVYSILIKRKPPEIHIWTFQLTTFALGLLFLIPFYLWDMAQHHQSTINATVVGAILYVGIGASLISYIFWNRAIEYVGPAKAGMVYYTLPLFCGALAYLILDEKLSMMQLVAAALILSGIFTATRDKTKAKNG